MLIRVQEAEEGGKVLWLIRFPFDEELKDYLKDIVPSRFRSWDPSKKVWVVRADPFVEDPVNTFLNFARSQGHKVDDTRTVDWRAYNKIWDEHDQNRKEEEAKARKAHQDYERLKEEARRAKQRARATPPPPPRTSENWAEILLRAVGPSREDAVFKALTRVLHPDAKTGDEVLMKELNIARDKRSK
jgi:hypothetical protein